jgi:CheY-like chemotaxis protein
MPCAPGWYRPKDDNFARRADNFSQGIGDFLTPASGTPRLPGGEGDRTLGRMASARPRTRRIAIADDSPAFVSAVSTYVESLPGYELAGTARTSVQALALVETQLPDVLLLDLGLPPMRGLDFLRRLKALPGGPAVVAMTLFHTPEAAAEARRAGADALVGKEAFVSGLNQALAQLFPG